MLAHLQYFKRKMYIICYFHATWMYLFSHNYACNDVYTLTRTKSLHFTWLVRWLLRFFNITHAHALQVKYIFAKTKNVATLSYTHCWQGNNNKKKAVRIANDCIPPCSQYILSTVEDCCCVHMRVWLSVRVCLCDDFVVRWA